MTSYLRAEPSGPGQITERSKRVWRQGMWGHNIPLRPWADEEVATIQRMWADGYSASVISLNLEYRSRNAVIGKLHRLGGYKRPDNQPSTVIRGGKAIKARPPRKRHPKIKPPRPYTVQPEYIPVDPIRFIDRGLDQCAFIAGDPRQEGLETMCCGARAVFGGSWCSHHIKTVFAIVPLRKDRRAENGRNPSRFVFDGGTVT